MMRDTPSLMLLIWMSFVGIASAQPCDRGWYGSPTCEYKCRCQNNNCNNEGVCTPQIGCVSGWFGPLCQYVNLASQDYLDTGSEFPVVLDGNDATCIQDANQDTVTVTWKMPYPFTWMRIVVKSGVSLSPDIFNVMFKNTTTQRVLCVNPKHSVISPRTLDIRCDQNMPVEQVILTGGGVGNLCSLYISGGRNVALKQDAVQSSTYDRWVASNAVNGLTKPDNAETCTSTTSSGETSQSLSLTLSRSHLVNRYVLYNRNNQPGPLKGFTITSIGENQARVFQHKDSQNNAVALIYTVLSLPVPPPVRQVRVNARDPGSGNGASTLSLCELEIYAECSVKSFGPDCSGTCSNDCLDQMCHHANGYCYDCVPGKRGDICDQECPHLTYGQGCKKNCSVNCAEDGSCNKQYGNCSHGCKPGYKGLICDAQCPPYVYGADCLLKCSKDCINEICNHITGHCENCVPGRRGDFCEQDCQAGSYGQECTQTCSENCNGNCDPRDGSCVKGCKPGYLGTLCDTPCSYDKFGQDCLKNCSRTCSRNETTPLRVCNQETGKCLQGCEKGFKGFDCSLTSSGQSSTEPLPFIGLIVGIAVAVVVLAIVVVAALYLWRRRRASKMGGETNQENKRNETKASSPEMGNSRENLTEAEPTGNILHKPNNGPTYYNVLPKETTPVNTSIPVAELGAFMLSHTVEYFKNQFQQIPGVNEEATTSAALKPENKNKNRYKNICAYDHSRVLLKINEAKQHGDYINASYVEGYNNEEKFIASQGPNKFILNDFVRLLWEQRVDKVVMLTRLIEEGKPKCERYWPEDDKLDFDGIEVKLSTTQVFADYTIRKLRLEKRGKDSHYLTHFHFTSWPDKGVPRTPWALVDFEQRVASYPTSRAIVVHCSAGVGRTGTFIGLRNLMREGADTGHMDFYNTLAKLRQDRVNMIQTADQYIFLHKAAQVATVCMGTTVTSNDIMDRMNILESTSASGMTNMAKEFEAICTVCAECEKGTHAQEAGSEESAHSVYENSRNTVNKLNNRFSNVLPKEEYRPVLSHDIRNAGDYINAVFVPSFSKINNQFLTQLPLPTTVLDFWRLVTQFNVTLIVAFEVDSTSDDSTVGSYLPVSEDEALNCGPFTIEAGEPQNGSFWEERQLLVSKDPKKTGLSMADVGNTVDHRLSHLKFSSFDLDPKTLLTVLKQIRCQGHSSTSHGKTLYMCRNGATYSGLVCVLSLLLDRMDNDLCLTVPLVVGAIKSIRPQVIPTLAQYKILYEVLNRYTETSTVYCNFDFKPTSSSLPDLTAKPQPKPKPKPKPKDSIEGSGSAIEATV